MRYYGGSIEDVLALGEYDQGDKVEIEYDELYDLVEQCKLIASELSFCDRDTLAESSTLRKFIEGRTNRPLHPALGGKSPYSEFLPL